jgi:multidrug efflux pump
MGLVIATGLAIGTLFTLVVVPAFYMMIGTDRQKAKSMVPTDRTTVAAH